MKYQVGDEIELRVRVADMGGTGSLGDSYMVVAAGAPGGIVTHMLASELEGGKLIPRRFMVGDKVRVSTRRETGEIAAIEERDVWLRFPDGRHLTFYLDALVRA